MNTQPLFSIQQEILSGQQVVTVKNTLTNERFSVLPNSGGRVRELHLHNGKNAVSIVRTIVDPDSKQRDDVFTNAKLSPFAGRISDGTFQFNKSQYQLPLNYPEEKNACHGFMFDKEFTVTKTVICDNQASCTVKRDYIGEIPGFPFPYSLELTYTLTAQGEFLCTTSVKNCSNSIMPLTDGWHHHVEFGESINDLKMVIQVSEMMELNNRNIPTGEKLSFPDYAIPQKIGGQHFDSCFHLDHHHGRAVTRLISKKNGIDLELWQETGFRKYNYLVIYTPPDRKSIAIEPMTSNVNAFNNSEDLIVLEPEEEISLRFGISIAKK